MKKTLLFLNLLIISFLFLTVQAQNTPPVWTGYYRGLGDNSSKFNKIIADGNGNFICTGYTIRSGNHKDIYTVKIDDQGNELWSQAKNGKGNGQDEAVTVGIDQSGNVYVAGTVDGGESNMDIIVLKYDASGNVIWDTTWNSPAFLDDIAIEMRVDGAGNCYVGGNVTPDSFAGSSDMITLKFATNGELLWSRQFTRPGVSNGKDELAGLTIDQGSGVFITGRSFNGSNDDFATIRYDKTSGSPLAPLYYNVGGNDRPADIVIDNSGNVIVAGRNDNGSNYDFRTIKYNNTLNFIWSRSYNAPANQDDRAVAVAVDLNNNVIITGYSDVDPFVTVNYDFQTLKYDSAGNELWVVRTGNGSLQDDLPNEFVIDNSGNIYVVGKSDWDPNPATNYDFMSVMYNASGVLQWSNNPIYHAGFFPLGDDEGQSLVLDGNGNLYLAGIAKNEATRKDAEVVKLDIATGNEVWTKSYGMEGDHTENAKSIVIDSNKNSYVAGYSFVYGQNLNGCIAKFDPFGNLVCSYTYNGLKDDDDEFEKIVISTNGSIYACGYTKVSDQKSNMLLVKWDSVTCDTVWTRTYDFVGQSDKAISMVLDPAGNIYLTGRSDSSRIDTLDNDDIVTIKYDANGNVLWTARFDGTNGLRDEPTKIILDNNGDVIVGGRNENTHDDIIVIKYNANTGAPIWSSPAVYSGPFSNDDRLNDILVDASNNIFVAGYSQTGSGTTTNDPVVLKLDPSGNLIGFNSYSGLGNDEAVKLGIDLNNDLFVAYKFDTKPGILINDYDIMLKKFDNLLTAELWSSPVQYNSPIDQDDIPIDLKTTPSGNVFVTGSIENDTSGGRVNKNWITLGYNSLGQQIFSSNLDGPNVTDDSPDALVISGNEMWVCGYTEGANNNQKDVTVVNYSLLGVSIQENIRSSSSVYPNPFNESCILHVNTTGDATLTLAIYDMLGNLVKQPLSFKGNVTVIERSELASGIYQYNVNDGKNIITYGKLIVQ